MAIIVTQKSEVFPGFYPCLKKIKNGETIVLFTSEKCGMVVRGNHINLSGSYSYSWFENYFEPYYGEVEMEERKCNYE